MRAVYPLKPRPGNDGALPRSKPTSKGSAAVVTHYIDRIIRDLDAGRYRHVLAQLDAHLWKDILKRLGVPDPLARATLEVFEDVQREFDPDRASSHIAARDTLTDLLDSWSD